MRSKSNNLTQNQMTTRINHTYEGGTVTYKCMVAPSYNTNTTYAPNYKLHYQTVVCNYLCKYTVQLFI